MLCISTVELFKTDKIDSILEKNDFRYLNYLQKDCERFDLIENCGLDCVLNSKSNIFENTNSFIETKRNYNEIEFINDNKNSKFYNYIKIEPINSDHTLNSNNNILIDYIYEHIYMLKFNLKINILKVDLLQNPESKQSFKGKLFWEKIKTLKTTKFDNLIFKGLKNSIYMHILYYYEPLKISFKTYTEINEGFNSNFYKFLKIDNKKFFNQLFFYFYFLGCGINNLDVDNLKGFEIDTLKCLKEFKSYFIKFEKNNIKKFSEYSNIKFINKYNDLITTFPVIIDDLLSISDCIPCQKCKLWSYIQFKGILSCLKILEGKYISKNEAICFFNSFGRIYNSLRIYKEMENQTKSFIFRCLCYIKEYSIVIVFFLALFFIFSLYY